MPSCVLRRAAKVDGTRYSAGATVVVSEAVHAQLVKLGVVDGVSPPPAPAVVRIPRSAREKQADLAEAQARIAKATGVPVPEAAEAG